MLNGLALRVLLTAGLAAASLAAAPSAQEASAVDVQSAFLLNFVRFTEWPEARRTGPLVACVFADDRLADTLARAADTEHIRGRGLQVGRVRRGDAITDCHVIFISRAAGDKAAALLAAARALPVLTVSDREGFAQNGGMVGLSIDNGRMRFTVNLGAARRSQLVISSRVLSLAKAVHGASAGL